MRVIILVAMVTFLCNVPCEGQVQPLVLPVPVPVPGPGPQPPIIVPINDGGGGDGFGLGSLIPLLFLIPLLGLIGLNNQPVTPLIITIPTTAAPAVAGGGK